MKKILLSVILLLFLLGGSAQTATTWNGKQAAVSLTYDDAIDIDIDHVAPALDSFGLKGTFYIIGSSPVVGKRLDAWKKIAMNGHELGNHTSFHPCDGSMPGRTFVTPDNDLSKYTLSRMTAETRFTNTLLNAIDGKTERTFAFPCGDKKIGNDYYYEPVKQDFVAARGVRGGLQKIDSVDLSDINCYSINGQNADYMINLVKKAKETHTLIVFLFHGVGGGHNLNVERGEHTRLLQYLKSEERNLWIAPMVDVARFIRDKQQRR